MTSIDDDMLLLRNILRNYQEGFAALARVEVEISRLERDQAEWHRIADDNLDRVYAADQQAESAEDEVARLRGGLEIIATSTYPARYVGEAKDGTKMYGDSGDAPRFARALLDRNNDEYDGREPDGYRLDGGRVIPTVARLTDEAQIPEAQEAEA